MSETIPREDRDELIRLGHAAERLQGDEMYQYLVEYIENELKERWWYYRAACQDVPVEIDQIATGIAVFKSRLGALVDAGRRALQMSEEEAAQRDA